MQLTQPIDDSGLIEELTRITSATIAVYTNKARIANLNSALDKYWFYAAESAPQGTFDDTNRTSAPIETQDLVAGTNAYKVSAFTNDVLQILRVSVLDSNGAEYDLVYQEFQNTLDFLEEYSTDTEDRGKPMNWTKIGDYIYLSQTPDYSSTGGLRVYVAREMSKFAWTTFTVTIASPGVFSATGHGLVAGDSVILETDGALPTGLTADTVVYYVISAGLTADAFEVSTTIGGSAVNTSGSQSGNHKFTKANKEPGIPVIHHDFLTRYASKKFMKSDHPNFAQTREELLTDVREIQDYWQSRERMGKTVIQTNKRAYR